MPCAPAEQVEKMRRLADEMLKLVRKRKGDSMELRRQIAEREIAFHQLVFDAAGRRLTSQFHQILVGYFDEAYGHGPHSAAPSVKDMQDHVKLTDAFQSRDVAAAVQIMANHFDSMLETPP